MRQSGNWMSTAPKDMLGREFKVGDKAARAKTSGRAVNIEVVDITRVEDDKVYCAGSKVAVNFPGRLLIVNAVYEANQVS